MNRSKETKTSTNLNTQSLDVLETSYQKLKHWIEDSIDIFKNDLVNILYPIYIHTFFDLIQQNRNEEARAFFEKFRSDHDSKSAEIKHLESLYTPQHLHENNFANSLRNSKYHLYISSCAFELLINFLEENNFTYILRIINQYLDIKVYVGQKGDEKPQGIDVSTVYKELDLTTFLVSKECEEAILRDEQYKYDHLEAYALQLKKQRELKDKDTGYRPNATQILAEINKLKDLCKRVSVNKGNLPSIYCYTVHNTYEGLTSSELSNDIKLLACGFRDSYIDIFSLSKEPLRKLKTSSVLSKYDIKSLDEEKFEDVGMSYRLVGHFGPVYGLKFFSSNKFLLSCSQDCTVRLWSLDLMSCVGVYKSHVFPIWCIDVAPNDFFFASGAADRQAILWSVSGTKPERLFLSSLSDVTAIKFHPNSRFLFTGSSDNKIRMHDIENAQVVRTFYGHNDTITCLDVSQCGKLLISGSKDKSLILWDIQNGKNLIKYGGHDGVVFSVSFSWYGTIIASVGSDNCVKLWDKSDAKGVCLGTYYTKNTPLYSIKFGYRNIASCVGPFFGA